MNTPQQQAELYRKAAETIEMCAEHGIEARIKLGGLLKHLNICSVNGNFDAYEFPLAVIEGQLVWDGDELYSPEGNKFKACKYETMFHLSSWNLPKRTVMVELLVEDAKRMADSACARLAETYVVDRVGIVCRKALDNLKG